MSVSDEERRAAEKTGKLVSKKLKEIMDLQGDIDALLREKHPTDTEQKNSASFGREDGASWTSGDELEGAARRGGAARHAGQCAE